MYCICINAEDEPSLQSPGYFRIPSSIINERAREGGMKMHKGLGGGRKLSVGPALPFKAIYTKKNNLMNISNTLELSNTYSKF